MSLNREAKEALAAHLSDYRKEMDREQKKTPKCRRYSKAYQRSVVSLYKKNDIDVDTLGNLLKMHPSTIKKWARVVKVPGLTETKRSRRKKSKKVEKVEIIPAIKKEKEEIKSKESKVITVPKVNGDYKVQIIKGDCTVSVTLPTLDELYKYTEKVLEGK